MIYRIPLILISTFVFLISASAQFVFDPLSPWTKSTPNIDSAIITITPFVNYAQVDLTLNYSAKNTHFDNNGSSLWLEVTTDFPIPDKTIVIDSWLWIEDYISEAYLIDLYTATNVYESYVTRTQDPSLLRYSNGHDDELSLNIYPLPADSYRKIKLSFLVPIINETTAFSIDPITNILMQESPNTPSYCEIKVNNNDTYISGSLRTALGNSSIKESNIDYTIYNMDLHAINEAFAITYDKSTPDNVFSFFEGQDLNYYALETFIPFDFDNCFLGNLNKEMNDSSLTYNELSNMEVYSSGFSYQESGNYFNDPPEDFVVEYVCGNQIFKDSLHITSIESPLTEKVWARDKIMDLTQNLSNSYSYYYGSNYEPYYIDILETSMDYRVLSFYTAFLALPQEDTVEASLEDNNFINVVSIEGADLNLKPKVNCYPNPFKEKLSIDISLPNSINLNDVTIRVIDITGKAVHSFKSNEFINKNEFVLEWFANKGKKLEKGIYFVLLEFNNETYTYEVLKQ